ncbi:hypothetical protein PGB90_005505 [Kerria lacca]
MAQPSFAMKKLLTAFSGHAIDRASSCPGQLRFARPLNSFSTYYMVVIGISSCSINGL